MKTIITSILLLLAAYACEAQEGLYITGGLGYTIPAAGQTADGAGNPYSGSINNFPASSSNNAYDVKKASFAAGGYGRLGVGYIFSKHVGVELSGAAVFIPQRYTVTEINVFSPAGNELVNATVKNYAQLPVFLMPALVYSTGDTKISGYARAGLALPLSSNVEREESNVHQTANESTEYLKEEYKTRFGLGIAGAMGVSYKAAASICIWLEANFISLSLYVKQETVTTHTYNGDNSIIPPIAGNTTSYGYNGTYATQLPAYAMPFSNAGITAGMKINLRKASDDIKVAKPWRKDSNSQNAWFVESM